METSTIFDWNDAKAEDGEDRFKVVGAIEGKFYVVVFTLRGDICWRISARRTNKQEDRIYGPLQT